MQNQDKQNKIPKQIYFTPREVEVVGYIADKNQITFSEQVRRILDKFIDSVHITECNESSENLENKP